MFNPYKDERLLNVTLHAGLYAYLCYFLVFITLGILQLVSDAELLGDPYFHLALPWFVSIFVFVGTHVAMGWTRTVREENSANPKQLPAARRSLFLNVSLFALVLFIIYRLELIGTSSSSIEQDALYAVSTAMLTGLLVWFFQVRRDRTTHERN